MGWGWGGNKKSSPHITAMMGVRYRARRIIAGWKKSRRAVAPRVSRTLRQRERVFRGDYGRCSGGGVQKWVDDDDEER